MDKLDELKILIDRLHEKSLRDIEKSEALLKFIRKTFGTEVTVFTLIERIRRINKYLSWRKKILSNNKICSYCKVENKEMDVHHIVSIKEILKKNRISNLQSAIVCEELWDLNNAIVLCKRCHLNIHKRKCND